MTSYPLPLRALALCALLAGCGGPHPAPSGTLRFDFSGDLPAGGYEATGSAPVEAGGLASPDGWAVANTGPDADARAVEISATRAQGGRFDYVQLQLPDAAPGDYRIDPACRDRACTSAVVGFGFETPMPGLTGGPTEAGRTFCQLNGGTVRVEEAAGGRLRGTFSGSGSCLGGGFPDDGVFDVRDGTFDVPVVAVE